MSEVEIQAGRAVLSGNLIIPQKAVALVLFAHGSGSSRHSPRNQFVARTLNDAGLATLLFDLLTQEEEAMDMRTREHRFNIGLLAERLVHAAPTLLIVGGNDDIVIELNEMARDQMRCEVKLEILPGATHLFEEPGALEKVANLASDWFNAHLAAK